MSKQMEKSALGKKSSGVVLKEITKIFQQPDTGKDFVAVDHINLNIQDGEMVTLLGPSGCGKTTTLRMISGFEYPTSGSVFIGERDVAKIPPNKRGISMVIEPSVLLFDEPLSNLDAKLRESMRDELRALQKRLGITSLYVTHDQSEAMAISDRVVIMKDGVICQQGTPTEIYEQPNSRFVANFIGKANFIDGTFRGMDGENALVEVGGHTFPIPAPGKMEGVQKDGPCCLAVRPESILLSEEEGPLSGRVSRATYYGAKVEYEVMLGDQPIIVEVYNPQLSKRFAEGEAVHMTLIDRCVRVLA